MGSTNGYVWDWPILLQIMEEAKSEGQLAFLDVLISQNPGGPIDTTVYRKQTHTNNYFDISSHHSIAHKIAVVRTLYPNTIRRNCCNCFFK